MKKAIRNLLIVGLVLFLVECGKDMIESSVLSLVGQTTQMTPSGSDIYTSETDMKEKEPAGSQLPVPVPTASTAPAQSPSVEVIPEPAPPKPTYDASRSEFNIGTCRTLTEDAAVVVLFADDDESSWDQAARQTIYEEVNAALSVLKSTAASYGYTLELPILSYYSHDDRVIRYSGTIKNGGADLDALQSIALNWGFRDKWDMHAALQQYTGKEQIAYIVTHNKPGPSYAQSVSHWGDNDDWCLPEYAVVSSASGVKNPTQAVTYLHELLHLFGAQDIYRKDFTSVVYNETRAAMAERIWPNEVMLCDCNSIQDVQISDFTAYAVGLLDTIPEWCDCAEWWVGSQWESVYTGSRE